MLNGVHRQKRPPGQAVDTPGQDGVGGRLVSYLAAVFEAGLAALEAAFMATFCCLAAVLAAFFSDFATLVGARVEVVARAGVAMMPRRSKRSVHVSWDKFSNSQKPG